jgi:hypothetical protein
MMVAEVIGVGVMGVGVMGVGVIGVGVTGVGVMGVGVTGVGVMGVGVIGVGLMGVGETGVGVTGMLCAQLDSTRPNMNTSRSPAHDLLFCTEGLCRLFIYCSFHECGTKSWKLPVMMK